MIPAIEEILVMLARAEITKETAVLWFDRHVQLAREQAADRAMLAGMAMQSLLVNENATVAAVQAVKCADLLIAELNK